jgi:hypothetical protein
LLLRTWLQDLVAAGLRPQLVILETCGNEQELCAAEVRWMDEYGAQLYNYNIGGTPHPRRTRTEEQRRRLGEARRRGAFPSPSDETRQKLRERRLGMKLPVEWREAISEGLRGRVHTEETKRKIANSLRGRKVGPLSEEHRRKISESNRNQKRSDEARARMSVAAQERERRKRERKRG